MATPVLGVVDQNKMAFATPVTFQVNGIFVFKSDAKDFLIKSSTAHRPLVE
jgi:hypothetical protein